MKVRAVLWPVSDLADPGGRAFRIGEGDWPLQGFVVRRGGTVYAYENTCPHAGHPLNWRPDEFLTVDRAWIQCASHGALFQIETGDCVAGPCAGRGLRPLTVRIENEQVVLDVELTRSQDTPEEPS